VHDLESTGIRTLGCERVRVETSVLRNLGGSGVVLAWNPASERDSSDGLVAKCRIEAVGEDGVELAGSRHQVLKTAITNIGRHACFVRDDASGVVVSKCKLDDVGAFGVILAGTGNELVKTRIWNVEFDGVLAEGDRNALQKCKISDCGGDGIEVRSADSNVVEKNKIYDIGGSGIEVDGQSNRLLKNKVADVSGNGISVSGGANHLEKNKVSDITGHGLAMLPEGGNTVAKNKIRWTDGLDIYEEPDLPVPNVYEKNKYKTSNL
jgi:parallel beta-helix repeat protein